MHGDRLAVNTPKHAVMHCARVYQRDQMHAILSSLHWKNNHSLLRSLHSTSYATLM